MRGPPETWEQSPAHVGQEAAMKMASLLGSHIDELGHTGAGLPKALEGKLSQQTPLVPLAGYPCATPVVPVLSSPSLQLLSSWEST